MPRPASVTVFGVLNIAMGALGLLGGAATVGILIAGPNGQLDGPFAMNENRLLSNWLAVATVLGLVASVVLIAAGIGLLRMRPWGRTASLVYAGYAVVSSIVGLAINWVFLVQPMLNQPADAGRADPAEIGGAIGGMIGGCIGFIFPVLLWYFMTRPAVVAAFSGLTPATDAGGFPLTTNLEPDIARDPSNPYLAPRTDSVPIGATTSGDSIIETFVPSKNAPALWSYYLGLFSLFPCFGFFLGVVAVYMGIKGLRLVRANPEVRGGAHAWVGIVCGGLFGFFNFLLLAISIFGAIVAIVDRR